ncbi:hypothetical protein [Bacteroides gallinarum]|uniref:hypothetical protein n=1 Tax=Bacteroides gallinarum TaxID=376806 RepID=UPI0003661C7B|nr:hypothetical protein [Bacteroides gallinarum]
MYEARQNKERVSRQIDGGCGVSQRVRIENCIMHSKVKKIQENSIDTPVQRSIGFEAELCVPTMNKPQNDDAESKINTFLKGGVGYGVPLGQIDKNIRLTSDHNNLANTHIDIRKALIKQGYTVPKLEPMTNLEYVTDPFNELDSSKDCEIDQAIENIANHTKSLFNNDVDSKMIPIPNSSYYTGIPKGELETKYNGKINNEISNFQTSIKDSYYIQATAGIIPSAVRDLHNNFIESEMMEINGTPQKNIYKKVIVTAINIVDEVIKALETEEWFCNANAIKKIKKNNYESYESFMGILYLAYMYMLGSAINQTTFFGKSTIKNAVPFMLKLTNMKNVCLADKNLDDFIIKTKSKPNKKKKELIKLLHSIDVFLEGSAYATPAFWESTITGMGLKVSRADENDKNRTAIVDRKLVSNIFRENKEKLTSSANTAEERGFNAPDEMDSDQIKVNQEGLQLEYRYIFFKPDSNNLKDTLWSIVNEVREHNKKWVRNRQSQV